MGIGLLSILKDLSEKFPFHTNFVDAFWEYHKVKNSLQVLVEEIEKKAAKFPCIQLKDINSYYDCCNDCIDANQKCLLLDWARRHLRLEE